GEPAVAGQDRRDTVPDGGRAEPIPERLDVVVRVEVDDAGSDEEPLGVDRRLGRAANTADLRDPAVLDCDVSAIARKAGPVDDHPVPDDEVVRHGTLPAPIEPLSSTLASLRSALWPSDPARAEA